jgi:hypothetical protein
VLNVQVDPTARPLLERIECQLQIDHDYVVTATLRSTGRGAEIDAEFHDLDFGLALPLHGKPREGPGADSDKIDGRGSINFRASPRSNLAQRVNVVLDAEGSRDEDDLWRVVPGDIVTKWRPNHFDNRTEEASRRQNEERSFYTPCSRCRRLISQIEAEGPLEECRGRPCGKGMARLPTGTAGTKAPTMTPDGSLIAAVK